MPKDITANVGELIQKSVDQPTVQDLIAPSAVKITPNFLQIGTKLARTIFIFTYPRYLNTAWLSPVINLDRVLDLAIFVHPTDIGEVLKKLRKKLTEVESQIAIEREKGLVRDPVLDTARKDIEDLRDRLIQGTEKLFKFGLYITIYADTPKELNDIEEMIMGILEARLVYAKSAVFQQDIGFESTLPLASDHLFVNSNLNTAPLSTTFPFVSSTLTSDRGILYGLNRHNNSLVLFDRFELENANMTLFGKSGSGKSYGVKLEILRSLMLGNDVIVIDPENEYKYLAEMVGGTIFNISVSSPYHINPFDLPPPRPDESAAEVLRGNIINLTGLLKIMLGQLTAEEDAILDKALTETYASRDITPESDFSQIIPPLLGDLQTVLGSMEGGGDIAKRLSKYTEGSFSGFVNQATNVDIRNKLVVFSVRDMEEELRPIAMYIVLQHIWNIIRAELKKRLVIVDEAWWLMKYPEGGLFLYGIAKRGRKYFVGLTTITQDVPDFMTSAFGKPIVTNSSIQLFFKQSPAAVGVVQQTFNLTEEEKYLLLSSDVGEGLLLAGLKHIAVKVIASYTEDQIITSDPQQLLALQKAKEEFAVAAGEGKT